MKKILKIILLLSLVVPLSAKAFSFDDWFDDFGDWFDLPETINSSDTQVINEIKVEANTGGNQVSGDGEVSEGKSEASVEIETIINGQSIEPVSEEVKSEGGEPASISVEQKIVVPSDGEPQVEREIEINSEESEKNYEVELKSQASSITDETVKKEIEETKESLKEKLNVIEQWWLDFVDKLKRFWKSVWGIK